MTLFTTRCPFCQSSHNHIIHTYETPHDGTRALYQCDACEHVYSDTTSTFLEKLRTPLSEIWQVLQARTDGLGLKAAVRTFGSAKHSMLRWERTCSQWHEVLVTYALVQECVHQTIAGDEA